MILNLDFKNKMKEDKLNDDDELQINPDKVNETMELIQSLLDKKNKTDEELCKLHILCQIAFRMTPKKVKKLLKWIRKRIPKDVKKRPHKELMEYEIERLLDKVCFSYEK